MPLLIKSIMLQTVLLLFVVVSANADNRLVLGGIEKSINHKICATILWEIYEGMGYQVDFKVLPARRSLILSNLGKIDGEVQRIDGISKTQENLVKVPVPIFQLLGSAYSINKDLSIRGWESLRPYKIGIRRGLRYAEVGTEGMNRIFASSEQSLIHMLKLGRIDILVSNTHVVRYHLKNQNDKTIIELKPPVVTLPLYHYLHKQHQELVDKVGAKIQQMKENGRLQEIHQTVLNKHLSISKETTD